MTNNIWISIPLKNLIINILEKRQGVIIDDDLERILSREYGELSPAELNRALMSLEINGIIHVSQITKTKRRIEKIRSGQEFLSIDED